MLTIENLHAQVEGKAILKGIDLDVKAGEIHAIMGPNGSGKSTLSSLIAGNEEYELTKGKMLLRGKDLSEMDAESVHMREFFFLFSILLKSLEFPLQTLSRRQSTRIERLRAWRICLQVSYSRKYGTKPNF
jgi:ABC-type hemin transport system ATPase subunit